MTRVQYTIDAGIDLGTTNSALAIVADGRPHLVENNRSQLWTPSAAWIPANGSVRIGAPAYERRESFPNDVATEFKRWMGSTHRFAFQAANLTMSAPELSAEVLKALRGDAEQRFERALRAAVITVPAAFNLTQCHATQAAAELAGLVQTPLMQEPVAASLAYGFSANLTDGQWLVYDLGGGTFDLALVGIEDGQVRVLDHEGDNYLGGKDLDWAIVEKLIIPRLSERYQVAGLSRTNAKVQAGMAILKAKAEEAKIELSRAQAATVAIESGRVSLIDDEGREIEQDIVVTRADYEALIRPILLKTVALSKDLLQRQSRVRPDCILLVGGPTLTPLVRRLIGEELGIAVNTTANPLTVVAEGAALYAASQPLEVAARVFTSAAVQVAPVCHVELRYAAVTDDEIVPVALTATGESAAVVEVSAASGGWNSGRVPLKSGAAVMRAPLPGTGAHVFRVRVSDVHGNSCASDLTEFVVYRGLTAAPAPLSRTIGVVVRDEGSDRPLVEPLLLKNSSLPAAKSKEFRTTVPLDPDGEETVVGIYLVEGDAHRPERDHPVGMIEIKSRDMLRLVPANSPIEVRVNVDTSRLLRAQALVALTDQPFDVTIRLDPDEPTVSAMTDSILVAQGRLDDLSMTISATEIGSLREEVEIVRRLVLRSEADSSCTPEAAASLRTLQLRLDTHEEAENLPRAQRDGEAEFATTSNVVTAYGSESQSRRLAALANEFQTAAEAGNLAEVERTTSRVTRLRFEVLAQQPWFWKEWFEYLADSHQAWTDDVTAESLVRDGRQQLLRQDFDGLRHTTFQLSSLAPGAGGSFVNATIRRSP